VYSFANNMQCLYYSTNGLISLKNSDNDMISFIVEAQSVVEELNMLLEIDSLDEIKKKLDKFYTVMILRAMNWDFYHVRDQILLG